MSHDRDPDVPEADAQEQEEEWVPEESEAEPVTADPDVPEADALEQTIPVDVDDEEGR
jgi:hypothetical protein